MDREQLEDFGFSFHSSIKQYSREGADDITITAVMVQHKRAPYIYTMASDNSEIAWWQAIEWATEQVHQLGLG